MVLIAPNAGQYAKWATIPGGQGRISHFGGPNDRGVKPNERISLYPAERCREPRDDWYVALRWGYAPHGSTLNGIPKGYFDFLRAQRIRVTNPRTGASVRLRPADWGPHSKTKRLVDVSPKAMQVLGVTTDQTVVVAWDTPGAPLGPATGEPGQSVAVGVAPETVAAPSSQQPAFAPIEVAPGPTTSLVAGMGTYSPTTFQISGVNLEAFGPVIDASLSRSMDAPSTLSLSMADPSNRVLLSGLLSEAAVTELDGIRFVLQRVNRNDRGHLDLDFVEEAAAKLIAYTFATDLVQNIGTGTRGDWCRRIVQLAAPGIPVDIQPGQPIQRSLEAKAGDSAWAVLGQVAEDVKWSRFATAGRLVIGSDEWLMRRAHPITIREHANGVHSIAFDLMPGVVPSEATVVADAPLWPVPPSSAVRVERCGPADGDWLVTEISRSLTSVRSQIKLRRVEQALAEPVQEAPSDSGSLDLTIDPLHPNQGGVSGTATRCTPDVVTPSRKWTGRAYVWGPYDCSATVSKGCIESRVLNRRLVAHGLWTWASGKGLACSVADAKRTYGAMLFRIGRHRDTGRRQMVHVAWSLGNGRTFEARKTGTRIGEFPERHDWTHAARVPGVVYQ